MKVINNIEVLDKIYYRKNDTQAIIWGLIIGGLNNKLLNINIKNIKFSKSDIAKYYNISNSILNKWYLVFVKNGSLKEELLSRGKISSYIFIKLLKIIGNNNLFIFLDFNKIKTDINLLNNENKVIKYEYKPYSIKELSKLIGDNSTKDTINNIRLFLNMNSLKLTIIPPKQSLEFIIHQNEYKLISPSIALFNFPNFEIANNNKSKMNLEKQIKKFFKDRDFSDYELGKYLDWNSQK